MFPVQVVGTKNRFERTHNSKNTAVCARLAQITVGNAKVSGNVMTIITLAQGATASKAAGSIHIFQRCYNPPPEYVGAKTTLRRLQFYLSASRP